MVGLGNVRGVGASVEVCMADLLGGVESSAGGTGT
jgi:hypothetical protein